MKPPTVREIVKRLEAEGWELKRIRGDHRVFAKDGKTVVVAGNMNDTVARGTWSSIKKQAGW